MDLLLTYLALDSQQSINQMKEEVVGAVAKTLPAVERHVRIKGGVLQNHLKDDKEYRLDNSQKVQKVIRWHQLLQLLLGESFVWIVKSNLHFFYAIYLLCIYPLGKISRYESAKPSTF